MCIRLMQARYVVLLLGTRSQGHFAHELEVVLVCVNITPTALRVLHDDVAAGEIDLVYAPIGYLDTPQKHLVGAVR